MKRFMCLLGATLFVFVFFLLAGGENSSAQNSEYTFTITRADARLLDDVVAGIEIEITCQRKHLATGRVGTATVGGYIAKTEFAEWPPTLPVFRQYLINWLKIKVGGLRRLNKLIEKADEPVISHSTIAVLVGKEIVISR